MTVSVPYSDAINPYKQWWLVDAFRRGYEWAEEGKKPADCEYLHRAVTKRPQKAGWWRGYYTQRGEYEG